MKMIKSKYSQFRELLIRYSPELILITCVFMVSHIFQLENFSQRNLENQEKLQKDLKVNTDITIRGDSVQFEKVESLKETLKKIQKNENPNK